MADDDEVGSTRRMETSRQGGRSRRDPAQARAQAVGLVADIIRWIGLLFAVVLVIYIILYVGGANPQNGITTFIRSWADGVSLGFKDLFTPADENLRVLVNYGIAAIFWLVVTMIVAKLLRRLAHP